MIEHQYVNYVGSYYSVNDFTLEIPLSSSIPLFIAGSNPSTVRLAGEIADGVMIDAAPLPAFPKIQEFLRDGAKQASRSLTNFKFLGSYAFGLDHSRTHALEQARRYTTFVLLSAPEYYLKAANINRKQVDRIRQALPDFEKASSYITEEMISTFAIVGTPQDVITQISGLQEAGMDEVSLIILNRERDQILKLLEHEVFPSL